MGKDVYYFPHDYEPTADPKIQALLAEYGGLGYGVYWRLVEMMHSDSQHKLPMKDYVFIGLSKQMLVATKQISEIINYAINTAELFESDGNFFWSARVNGNIALRKDISIKRALAGKKGGKKRANASSK